MKLSVPELTEDLFLHLSRPVIFFDLETTGVDVCTDRIVELCAIKVFPDGTKENLHHLVNPGRPIPASSTNVHGISSEQVQDMPLFRELASKLTVFFTNCDLAGFNLKRFDIPLLMQEFHRCELYPILLSETKVIDAYNLFVKKVPRTLSGALSYYCGEDHTSAHSAQGDIEATMKVLKHQLLHYNDLDPSVDFLHQYTADGETSVDFSGKFGKNNNGQVVFRFGEHRDKIVDVVVHKSYLDWMCEGDKFPIDTIMVIHRLRRHHKWQSEFKTWLDKTELLLDLEKTYILYQTLVSEKSCEPFMYSSMERRIEISCPNLPILVLEGSDAKHLFLVMLKNHFNEMGGLEFLRERVETLRKTAD